ncbi:helix-turn-helix domain-containing protein [Amycolatopsis sp. FU40]|uniref:helix-turn-helix domain-containing protein n=1 Tax=Amycolatopsis sp. FU40 TaxID=2914159 RepID=UPI001F3DA2B5|nr:helix-turn-helix domain-containing protein [Amycolatopsis sp. FU40]UKD56942.1 helix-turn-helix domain-containing protein [Amycolatopsis sp. FU40]
MTAVGTRPGEPIAADLPPPDGMIRLPLLVSARRGWFSVAAPASGLDRPLAGAIPWDPARLPGRHQLVLMTKPRLAADDLAQALTAAGRAGSAALVVREGALPAEADLATAAVPVLVAAEQIEWAEIGTVVRSLLSGARFGGVTPTAAGLCDLAESAALALGGAVVVTDAAFRVLAFGCGESVDALTSEMVLARRVPAELRKRLAQVRSVARLDLPDAGPRWAAPIRSGTTIGGYVLCAPRGETSVAQVLSDLSAAAAAWFIDEPAGRDDEDAIRAELLRGLLTGPGSLEALTERLGTSRRWRLAALGEITPDREGALARCARMLNPNAATATLGSLLFVLFPSTPDPGPADFAERLRRRASTTTPLVACLGRPCATAAEIRAELDPLRHASRVLTAPATAHLTDLLPHVLISELAELAAERPALLDGSLDVLRRDSSPRGAEYLNTLRCWFDAGGDATRAAAALRIHRNTFRYRLHRIEELCAVDLDDPVQRFTIELQTRLLASPLASRLGVEAKSD